MSLHERSGVPEPSVRVAGAGSALFASDMHLDDSDPALTRRFLESLDAGRAASVADLEPGDAPPALFLLGDLFEYWIGDDEVPPAAQAVADRLAAFADAGGRVFLMHGNRDFLLDAPLPQQPDVPKYSARCHATLLPDPCLIEVQGRRIVLSHGDALCTDDHRYQQWRALCRSADWQRQFLGRPVAERRAMALQLRQQSMQAQAATETLSDVNRHAAEQLMRQMGSALLIHGHTHRPRLHRWPAPAEDDQDPIPAGGQGMLERWVLSDWGLTPPRGALVSAAAIPPAC